TAAEAGASPGGPIDGVLVVAPDVALRISAMPGTVPAGGTAIGPAPADGRAGGADLWTGFLLALGGALLGGLILNIMPCVFPILSLKAISLAKAGGDERQARREALAYTGGILATCLALGALMLAINAGGTQIGWACQLQDPRLIALLLLPMAAMRAVPPASLAARPPSLGRGAAARGGSAVPFWAGARAVCVATPCRSPSMATGLWAALVLPSALARAVFAWIGLGPASPFLAI